MRGQRAAALTGEHPQRPRLVGSLMRALHAAGRDHLT
jgi:hypothetical protein